MTATAAGITTTVATSASAGLGLDVMVMMPREALFQQAPDRVQSLGQRPSVDGDLTGLVLIMGDNTAMTTIIVGI